MTGVTAAVLSLTLAGCGSSGEDATAQPTPPPPAVTASSAAPAVNAASVRACATAGASIKAFVSTVGAASNSDGVTPPAKVKEALSQLARELTAVKANDAELAAALKELGKGAATLAAAADPLTADGSAYEKAGDHLESLCKAAGWAPSS